MGIHLAQVGDPTWSVLAYEKGEAAQGGTDKGSPGLSVASRPLCSPPLQAPLAPPTTARRPQLRQTYQHHCAPGPASITSVPSRPAAA